MTLLIVDDQLATLKGLERSIDWQGLGIDAVRTAQNAMEARVVFKNEPPDILLCDIEMPVESGISLCRWVRDHGFVTEVIFLTCHSEFDYARDAISLGAAEYIVQPSPYTAIHNAVSKAATRIRASRNQQSVLDRADSMLEQWEVVRRGMWRTFLLGAMDAKAFAALDGVPKPDEPGYLVLLQIVRWNTATVVWQDHLIAAALASFLQDIFPDGSYLTVMAHMERHTYAIAIRPEESGVDIHPIIQMLNYLCKIYDMYMPCAVACYLSEQMPVGDMPQAWNSLLQQRGRNVSGESGVFCGDFEKSRPAVFSLPQISHWKDLLALRLGAKMEGEAIALLDEMIADGTLTPETLRSLYQDFMKMLYSKSDSAQWDIGGMFQTPETIELYRNGMRSADDMKALIRHVARIYSVQISPSGQAELAAQIAAYINSHLDENIRKSDLGNRFHLNEDYLTKIFKREMDISIKSYIIQQKLLSAQKLLCTTTLPISYIAARFGYSNFSHFSTAYKKQFGITPQEEQKNHRADG